jgi:adenosylcobinamide-GDP ribazoletransferase
MENWLDDLRGATAFLTRIPIAYSHDAAGFQRAMRAYPLVGAAIGLVAGLLQLALLKLGLPPLAAAALTLGASALLTGALHEDGLADIADGFGGGRDKAAKLAIMRDSRLGTYGTLALLVSFAARLAALAALPSTMIVAALVAVHALARAVVPGLALMLPFARHDGLAAGAGQPDSLVVATSLGLGAIIALICLPWNSALGAIALAVICASVVGWLAMRQIGGVTGDVLGATEQVAETAILLSLAARLG